MKKENDPVLLRKLKKYFQKSPLGCLGALFVTAVTVLAFLFSMSNVIYGLGFGLIAGIILFWITFTAYVYLIEEFPSCVIWDRWTLYKLRWNSLSEGAFGKVHPLDSIKKVDRKIYLTISTDNGLTRKMIAENKDELKGYLRAKKLELDNFSEHIEIILSWGDE